MDEKDAVKNFLNEVTESKEIFKEEAEIIKEPVIEEVAEEKPLPFHRDPKVQRYIEKQIEKGLEKVKPSAEQQFRKEVDEIKLPPSFIRLVGNDTPEKVEVLKDLSTYFRNLKGEARKEFLEELRQQEIQAKEADIAALDELNSGFEQIEEDYGVNLEADKKTRASFVEYLRKVSPKNEEGEVERFADIPSTWETFQELNNRPIAPQSRAKALASRGMARSSDAQPAPTRPTSWRDVDQFIAKLKN